MPHKTLTVAIDPKLFDRLNKLANVPIDLTHAHYAALHVGIGALERVEQTERERLLKRLSAAAPPQRIAMDVAQQEQIVHEALRRAEAARIEVARAAREQDEAEAHLIEAKARLERYRTADPVAAPARSLPTQSRTEPPSRVREGTWSDKIAWVLGDEVMSAAEIDVALKRAGLIPRTSQTLVGVINQLHTRRTVLDAAGDPVTNLSGEPVQVRVFEQVTQGMYRLWRRPRSFPRVGPSGE